MALRLSLTIVLALASPILASEPFPLAPPEIGLADYFDGSVIASDGERYLALLYSYSHGVDSVYRLRLDGDGEPLDPHPVLLLPDEVMVSNPLLLWRGDRYVLIWGTFGLHYAEISRDGELLELVSPWIEHHGSADAAWNGDSLLVVARERHGRGDVIRTFRIGDGGAIESSRTIATENFDVSIAAAGERFGVLLQGFFESRLLLLASDGSVEASRLVPRAFGIAAVGSMFHLPVFRPEQKALDHVVAGADGTIVRIERVAEGGLFYGARLITGRDRVAIVFRERQDPDSAVYQSFYVARDDGEVLALGRPRSDDAVLSAVWAANGSGEVVQILGDEMRVGRSVLAAPLLDPAAFAAAPALVRAPLRQSSLRITAGESV
ncbi:MAG: hypothetical protein ACRD2J_16395, partial [Thermoanaerobaculia bacterium]